MSRDGVALPGLDGGTPLGFLAALGVLRVAAGAAGAEETAPPRLSWRMEEAWHPVIHDGPRDLEELAHLLAKDAGAWADSSVLRFRYPKLEKKAAKLVGALQPPVAVFRAWLRDRILEGDAESLAYAAALTSETATGVPKAAATAQVLREHGIPFEANMPLDRVTMPTAFDFTSRNAQFLEQVDAIRASLDPEGILAVLRNGATENAAGRTMDWDPIADAPGAIYGNRATAGRAPAAEWLAFRGLAFFPVAGEGETLYTTACSGRRKAGLFVWPLWHVPADMQTIASLLRSPDLDKLESAAKHARGISQIFRAQLTKKADGYSGMFAPSEAV